VFVAPDDVNMPVSAGSAPAVGGRKLCEGTVGGFANSSPAVKGLGRVGSVAVGASALLVPDTSLIL